MEEYKELQQEIKAASRGTNFAKKIKKVKKKENEFRSVQVG
jgi:uncharacterized membrane protein (DUF106 family)